MNAKSVAVAVAVGIGAVGGTAWGAQTIASVVGADGVIHGCYEERSGAVRVVEAGAACDRRELPIQWNQQGPKGDKGDPGQTGPKGDTGPPGPALTSLAGIPCDTDDLDRPDGRTEVTVAATGAMTFACRTSSTNPVLTAALVPGPDVCVVVIGIPVCTKARFSVREVDAAGSPIANGFTCLDPHNLSTFSVMCSTQRFGLGATVRLEAFGAPTGFTPFWEFCDAVSGAVCTVTLTQARDVFVTPVGG